MLTPTPPLKKEKKTNKYKLTYFNFEDFKYFNHQTKSNSSSVLTQLNSNYWAWLYSAQLVSFPWLCTLFQNSSFSTWRHKWSLVWLLFTCLLIQRFLLYLQTIKTIMWTSWKIIHGQVSQKAQHITPISFPW